jgi:SAM-dependent methyltransferase
MAVTRIKNDPYVLRLRQLFEARHYRDLEFALTPEGVLAAGDTFFVRTLNYHTNMVPWIESVFPLAGASVLEIGCGAGAATIAMAQRCGHVDAFDIDQSSLNQARHRLVSVGARNVDFHRLDPDWAQPDRIEQYRGQMQRLYDVILLPAVLEHMQLHERLSVLKTTWEHLRVDGIVVIYDTPNRLHPFDEHSFRLPFFHWLPDDLALLYASYSPREDFPSQLAKSADPMQTLYRLGRGVSYHEFDLAIGLNEFNVVQDGYSHLLTHRGLGSGLETVIVEALRLYAPHVPRCFGREFLEFIAQKKWHKLPLRSQHCVDNRLLDDTRPGLVLDGSEAMLEYEVSDPWYDQIRVEVLRHPWSSKLVFCNENGKMFHSEVLTADYPLIEILHVPLPPGTRRIRLQVQNTGAKGNEAWVFGIGLTKIAGGQLSGAQSDTIENDTGSTPLPAAKPGRSKRTTRPAPRKRLARRKKRQR